MTMPDKQGVLLKVLDFCYDRAIGSSGNGEGAARLASEYTDTTRTLEESIDALIRWQNAKCAATGFITGLGGLATLPITLPADLFANYFIQVRMIAAIAIMAGHDLKSDKVRSMVYICLCGNAAVDLLKDAGTQFGKRAAEAVLARTSARGAVNFGKAIPLLGGVIGGTVDGMTCNLVGKTAKNVFLRGGR